MNLVGIFFFYFSLKDKSIKVTHIEKDIQHQIDPLGIFIRYQILIILIQISLKKCTEVIVIHPLVFKTVLSVFSSTGKRAMNKICNTDALFSQYGKQNNKYIMQTVHNGMQHIEITQSVQWVTVRSSLDPAGKPLWRSFLRVLMKQEIRVRKIKSQTEYKAGLNVGV